MIKGKQGVGMTKDKAKMCNRNKNDNIQKNEVQDIRWSDEYWQV